MEVDSSNASTRWRKRLRDLPSPRAGFALAAVAALAVGFLATTAGSREPKLYSWTDDEGVIRYTPHRRRVPSSRRSTAKVVQSQPELPDVAAEPPQLISLPPERDPKPSLPSEPEAAAVAHRDPESVARAAVVEPEVVAHAAVPDPEPEVTAMGEQRFAIQLRSVPLAAGPTPLPLLAASEFRLYRTTVEVEGEVWERLRLGFFDDAKAARRQLAQLGRSFAGAWIVRVSPSEWMLASRTTTGPSDSKLPPS